MKRQRKEPVLSSASGLLSGMSYPGHGVVREVRKGRGEARELRFYGGGAVRASRRQIATMARDRGFDMRLQQFRRATPQDQGDMLARSLAYQEKAKRGWLRRIGERIGRARTRRGRQRLRRLSRRIERAPIESPLVGGTPISARVRS